jgi:Flp pilus assembly pilin Flp
MKKVVRFLRQFAVWRDCRGQDMVEFALLVGLVAVASGLFLPGVADSVDAIYSRISSKLIEAGG